MASDTHHDMQDELGAAPLQRGRRREGRNGGRRLTAALVPLAILASGAMVYQASNAAFTATTNNGANNWTAGTVVLSDNDSNAALFNAGPIKPGTANGGSRCITVTYQGSLAADVKMFVNAAAYTETPGSGGGPLGALLRLTVEEGTGATDAACTGFTSLGTPKFLTSANQSLSSFRTANSAWVGNYGNGQPPWSAPIGSTTPQTRSYKVSYYLPDVDDATAPPTQAALDAVQGSQVAATFVWEARNT